MALPILDGNQSATTLSSILTSGEHIPAHTVVSLGTQAITDMQSAVSGSVVSISNFPATQPVSIASVTIGNTVTIAGTVTANPTGTQTIAGTVTANVADPNNVIQIGVEYGLQAYAADIANDPLPISGTVTVGNTVTIAGTVTANPTGTQTIAGTVTANGRSDIYDGANDVYYNKSIIAWGNPFIGEPNLVEQSTPLPISGAVTVGNSVTIGSIPAISGTVTADAGSGFPGVIYSGILQYIDAEGPIPITISSGTVTANVQDLTNCVESFDEGINQGVVAVHLKDLSGSVLGTSGTPLPISGTVTIGSALPAGTAQIGSVTASISNSVTIGSLPAISGTVTVGNSVTIGSLPLIAGTVTANLNDPTTLVIANQIDDALFGSDQLINALNAGLSLTDNVPISGTVTIGSALPAGTAQIGSVTASISGTVPVSGTFFQATQPVSLISLPALVASTDQIGSVTASISNSVTIASLPAISGTVTANSSNGSLTTRFGSVVTANEPFETSAVTNANRKYILIQNITTASNVITVGIGFTPTTTQGIQLFAGAGLTFEGSYIPTGAVNLLSSVTASCYTILEA